ncbi:hypothetical protein [uncultured Cytophaga sp.]|uniref:hypothetical protein n=1 Tax=uncultured Cytophaga sp. TaxID=160238 RepID=UPI002624A34E|nr:hypothetical protein [uncultured Cytophaga sp.]
MKHLIVFISIVFAASSALAQTGKPFPNFQTKKLTGQSFTLPDSVKGKFTIIGIAFSAKAEESLVTWYEPAYQTFIQKKKTMFASEVYNVNTYFVAVVTGSNKVSGDAIVKKIKQNTQKELQAYVLTYIGEFASYKTMLNITEKDEPYFFILDERGIIAHVTKGKYTAAKLAEIEQAVSDDE